MLELTVRRKPMRMAMMALSIVGAIDMLGSQNVGAVATNAAVVKEAVYANSTVQPAQFYARVTRHYVIKCYRELVIGPYVCHRFYRW
jgi:hypothetical protein